MQPKLKKILSFLLCFLLCFEQAGFAQVAAQIDIAGHLASLHSTISLDKFRPLHLRYLSYDGANNNFKLLLDKGDADIRNSAFRLNHSLKAGFQSMPLQQETKLLLNYFFIGLSLPNSSFWVNLRPDSPDNIIDDLLAQTDVGKIMLEADVQLKKDTALATSPQTPQGKLYWDKLYKRAEELFGAENITIPTLTRPWIVPGEIIIRETTDSAYIYKATLKVMLEEDYLKAEGPGNSAFRLNTGYSFNDPRLKALNTYAAELARELIIPKLNKEINTSKRYASLRQVYYSLILAQWFKARFKNQSPTPSLRARHKALADESISNLIDSRNLTNLTSKVPWDKQAYFKEYQKSFKDGEYNIQEPHSTAYGQAIRSYFSGGISGIAPNMPPFGAVTFTDPKTGASITLSPASGAISNIFRKGKKFLVPLLVSAAIATGVNSDTPLEFKVMTQEETPQITTPADSEIVTITTPKEIKEISQNDLIQIKLSSGTSYEFYRVKGTSVFYIEFGSVKLQNQALFRLSIFTESDTYSGRVLNDRQLSDVSEKREEVTGIGYDFRMEDICGFYTEAEKAGIALNELELKIKDDLLRFGFMEYRNRAYSPKQRIAIISCAQNSLPREDTVFHELRHGYYFSEPFVRESVMAIWNSIDSKQQVKIIKAVHMLAGYNSKNIDLILNELYASLLDWSSPLAGLVSGPDGPLPDVKLMQDLYSKFQKIEDEMHIRRVRKMMNDSIQEEMEKSLERIKNKSSSGQEEQSPENEDGSILGGDPKPPAVSSPVVVKKESGAGREEGRRAETPPNSLSDVADSQDVVFNELLQKSVENQGNPDKLPTGTLGSISGSASSLAPQTSLLSPEYINYYKAISDVIPRGNRRQRCLYAFSAADYSTSQILTRAKETILLDAAPWNPTGDNSRNLEKYKSLYSRNKQRIGYSVYTVLHSDLGARQYLLWELESMDARITNEYFDKDLKANRVNFILPGESEERTVLYFQVQDLTDENSYPEELINYMKTSKIDFYIQKAAQGQVLPGKIVGTIVDSLDSQGIIFLDNQPGSVALFEKNKNFSRLPYSDMRLIRQRENEDVVRFGYGNILIIVPYSRATEKPKAKKLDGIDGLASSPSIPDSEAGGIDFRALPIVAQAATGLSANISSLAIRDLVSVNLSEEWGRIEAMTSSGITPSPERIKEYIQTSCAQDSIAQNRDKLLLCISDILRFEEERCTATDPALKDILVVLDSVSSPGQLKEVFIGSRP